MGGALPRVMGAKTRPPGRVPARTEEKGEETWPRVPVRTARAGDRHHPCGGRAARNRWERMDRSRASGEVVGARGFTTTIHKMDVRPGGVWQHTMRGPDGSEYPNKSVFLEVVKPERIVFSHGGGRKGDPGAQFEATWTFEAQGNQTKLTLKRSSLLLRRAILRSKPTTPSKAATKLWTASESNSRRRLSSLSAHSMLRLRSCGKPSPRWST